VTLEILDAKGTVVRSLSSDDPRLEPDPALDPEGYDRICQQDPTAPNCRVPLYWPAPQNLISTRRGMHRVWWDLRFEPLGPEPRAGGGATGAVPGRTYPAVNAPWAPPGEYTVRLTVNGKAYTQPLSLRLDPRVKTPASVMVQVATLSREMYDAALAANAAYEEAREMATRLEAQSGAEAAALKARVEELAPAPRPQAPGGFPGAVPSGPPTLESIRNTLMAAAMAMQDAEVAPTGREIAACDAARTQWAELQARWRALKGAGR
jgi:hypothetical protein